MTLVKVSTINWFCTASGGLNSLQDVSNNSGALILASDSKYRTTASGKLDTYTIHGPHCAVSFTGHPTDNVML